MFHGAPPHAEVHPGVPPRLQMALLEGLRPPCHDVLAELGQIGRPILATQPAERRHTVVADEGSRDELAGPLDQPIEHRHGGGDRANVLAQSH
eukprot:1102533-Lingulodinium_polyedra.AAC.1